MAILVKLEYLTPDGWQVGHSGIALLHPERYVERLAAKGTVARATELDDRLQPNGRVWGGGAVPVCEFCDEAHLPPHDGSCLL